MQEKNSKTAQLTKENKKLQTKCDRVTDELQQQRQRAGKRLNDIKNKKAEVKKAQAELATLKKKYAELESAPETARDKVQRQREIIEEAEKDEADCQRRLEENQDDYLERTAKDRKEKTTLEEELGVAEQKVTELDGKTGRYRVELQGLTDGVERSKQQYEQTKAKKEEQEALVKRKTEELEEVQQQLPNAEAKLTEKRKRHQELKAEEDVVNREFNKLRNQRYEEQQRFQRGATGSKMMQRLMALKANGTLPGVIARLGDLGGIDQGTTLPFPPLPVPGITSSLKMLPDVELKVFQICREEKLGVVHCICLDKIQHLTQRMLSSSPLLNNYTKSLKDAEARMKQIENDVDATKVEELERKMAKAKKEHADAVEIADKCRAKVKAVDARINAVRADLLTRWEDDRNEAQKKRTDAEATIAKENAALNRVDTNIKKNLTRQKETEADIAQREGEIEVLEKEKDQGGDDEEELNQQKKEFEDRMKEIAEELKELNAKNDEQNRREVELGTRIKDLSGEVQVIKAEIAQAQKQIKQTEENRAKLPTHDITGLGIDQSKMDIDGDDLVKKRKFLQRYTAEVHMVEQIRSVVVKFKSKYQELNTCRLTGVHKEHQRIIKEYVEQIVRPPKKTWKKIQNCRVASTPSHRSPSFLALHKFRPTPLYFMDEIDAALDFRNVSIIEHYVKSVSARSTTRRGHCRRPSGVYEKASIKQKVVQRVAGKESAPTVRNN
ncbi:unnamed protein product, partial [Mesorhabditis spiculigera]